MMRLSYIQQELWVDLRYLPGIIPRSADDDDDDDDDGGGGSTVLVMIPENPGALHHTDMSAIPQLFWKKLALDKANLEDHNLRTSYYNINSCWFSHFFLFYPYLRK